MVQKIRTGRQKVRKRQHSLAFFLCAASSEEPEGALGRWWGQRTGKPLSSSCISSLTSSLTSAVVGRGGGTCGGPCSGSSLIVSC